MRLGFGLRVGGRPTASYLFCFAKKGNPKKATRVSLNSRKICPKMGKQRNSPSAQTALLSDPFSDRFFGSETRGFTSNPKFNGNSNGNGNPKFNGNSNPKFNGNSNSNGNGSSNSNGNGSSDDNSSDSSDDNNNDRASDSGATH